VKSWEVPLFGPVEVVWIIFQNKEVPRSAICRRTT